GLDRTALSRNVQLDHVIEIFRAVDDERRVDGLPGLRGARSARQHARALLACDCKGVFRFRHRARRNHADGHDLIMRSIGGIAAARERIEPDVAEELPFEAPLEARQDNITHDRAVIRSTYSSSNTKWRGCLAPRALTECRIRPSWRQVAAVLHPPTPLRGSID